MKRIMKRIIWCIVAISALLFGCAYAENDYFVYDTGHFDIHIPDGWIQRDTDGYTYFYAEEYGSLNGGMLAIQEERIQLLTKEQIQTVYNAYVSGISESDQVQGTVQSEFITIDGDSAIYAEFTQMLGGKAERISSIQYIVNGYVATLLYCNTTSDTDKDELLSFIDSLKYKFDKSPIPHVFGKKFVYYIGHKVITQNGYDCLVVEYRWWHNEDDPTAFMYSFSTEAYQNGVQCQSWILLDGNSELSTKIQNSTFLTCYDVFILNDASSPVSLYLDNIFDFGNQYENVLINIDLMR